MSQKCGGLGLNGIQLKWIIDNHTIWKNQNPGSRFGATCKTALQSSPFTAKMGQMGWIGLAVELVAPKWHQRFLFFQLPWVHRCQTFILVEIHCPHTFWTYYFFRKWCETQWPYTICDWYKSRQSRFINTFVMITFDANDVRSCDYKTTLNVLWSISTKGQLISEWNFNV